MHIFRRLVKDTRQGGQACEQNKKIRIKKKNIIGEKDVRRWARQRKIE